jgi:hypothetical protein
MRINIYGTAYIINAIRKRWETENLGLQNIIL